VNHLVTGRNGNLVVRTGKLVQRRLRRTSMGRKVNAGRNLQVWQPSSNNATAGEGVVWGPRFIYAFELVGGSGSGEVVGTVGKCC